MLKLVQAFIVLLIFSVSASAQNGLLIVNGGNFSGAETTTIGFFSAANSYYLSLDTIETKSVQDVVIDADRYAYVAVDDTLAMYDLQTGQKMAQTSLAFGAYSSWGSTYQGIAKNLVVGPNYLYASKQTGSTDNAIHIFDKTTLALVDSIDGFSQAVQSMLINGDSLYVVTDSVFYAAPSYSRVDTLGELQIVNLTNNTLQNTVLLNGTADLGPIVKQGNTLYTINNYTNTISTYNLSTGSTSTANAANNLSAGKIVMDAGLAYFKYDGAMGSYDLMNNASVNSSIVALGSYAFDMDTVANRFYISTIDYVDQTNNTGIVYNTNGDSLDVFPVSYSPEALTYVYGAANVLNSITSIENTVAVTLFPNPTTDFLQVEQEGAKGELLIFNALGQVVIKDEFNAQATVSVQELPAGTYYLGVSQSNRKITLQSFVKQ